ncbi:Hypothetical_protein [Hexamita inflata]|uniref:Hypothetical_protein n=1 Tax=Hexamita inflata TaxID=28002 RepID=A0AA86RC88_9EUKA|nr:Hypothetical protein HINF_LOCUS12647 [Hexamita inflata]CAI9965210.1 Hypothetical protein HINF_LOCUS52855 [Hexamita inflata]
MRINSQLPMYSISLMDSQNSAVSQEQTDYQIESEMITNRIKALSQFDRLSASYNPKQIQVFKSPELKPKIRPKNNFVETKEDQNLQKRIGPPGKAIYQIAEIMKPQKKPRK